MPELTTSPDFEAALRAGLARLAERAPVPDDAQLDALEDRGLAVPAPLHRRRRRGRHLALVAAATLVVAGIVGAVALRDRDADQTPAGRTKLSTGTTTSTTVDGPLLPARRLSAAPSPASDDAPDRTASVAGLLDPQAFADAWAEAGLAPADRPAVDFATEVVVRITLDDDGCPSPTVELRRAPAAVHATQIEPSSCGEPLDGPSPITYFYAVRWADAGRPFAIEVAGAGSRHDVASGTIG
jgi:hypothetical protein